MKFKHPFEWLPEARRRPAFMMLTALSLLVMASLQVLGKPLITAASPAGIISYEFAGDPEQARCMVESWGNEGRVYAGLNLGLDYLFLVSYGLAISLGCVLAAEKLSKRSSKLWSLGLILAWGQLCAALLDAIENYGLIRVLLGSNAVIWPQTALWCAVFKFILVGLGLFYVLAGGLASLVFKAFRK
jgi:hypothetical protein